MRLRTAGAAVLRLRAVAPLGHERIKLGLIFGDAPPVETIIIDRPDQPSLGMGEAVAGPTAAAIANAVFEAIGVRVRDLPLTRERVVVAINEA